MTPEYVYLFRVGGWHKIGVSADPPKRLEQVARVAMVSQSDAECLHLIASEEPYKIETALHHRFFPKAVKGEWFRLDDDDIALIRTVASVDSPDALPDALKIDGYSTSVAMGSRGRKPGPPSTPVAVRVDDRMLAMLDELVARTLRTRTVEMNLALAEHLRKNGFEWPPKAVPGEGAGS